MNHELYIGIMSGTSVDGIDAVVLQITDSQFSVLASLSHAFTPTIKQKILELFEPSYNEIDRLGELDKQLGLLYAQCVNQLLVKAKLKAADITAIGCHGQTLRHRPNNPHPFTLQIGDASVLANTTHIDVVSDFRKADIALGGQGAPLTPAFHHAAFHANGHERFIINIGGIANITHLSSQHAITGWDTGPGNGLMDYWINKHRQKPYDHAGQWASSGQVNRPLLDQLLGHPYFEKQPPKSTGKEEFTHSSLERLAHSHYPSIKPVDVQATLLELTARTIATDINHVSRSPSAEAFVCGGGAFNIQLINRLKQLSRPTVYTIDTLGFNPMHIEAAAFAWLAHQFTRRQTGNLPSVTGASKPAILGALTYHGQY
ncbi:anhydro-N-acetylmuramic acid kinase [Marinagarivorans algicola]|uniref:anhydro-N-acetylmuramic acid kinase n=1 Tax=Marinagarivorans algicola TaxID=1513270 RepID=UPI003736344A